MLKSIVDSLMRNISVCLIFTFAIVHGPTIKPPQTHKYYPFGTMIQKRSLLLKPLFDGRFFALGTTTKFKLPEECAKVPTVNKTRCSLRKLSTVHGPSFHVPHHRPRWGLRAPQPPHSRHLEKRWGAKPGRGM